MKIIKTIFGTYLKNNMKELNKIKKLMPSKISIPKEFDLFYQWTQNKENLVNENLISGGFENKRIRTPTILSAKNSLSS